LYEQAVPAIIMFGDNTPKQLVGWRFGAFVGCLVGAVVITLYPIAIRPMMDPSYYRKLIMMK